MQSVAARRMDSAADSERPLHLGLDLGASGFRAWRVERAKDDPPRLAIAGEGVERDWPAHGFEPVPLDEQLLEREAGGMRLSDAESREARDRVGAIVLALSELRPREHRGELRVAIAAPGLRVKDGRGLAVVRNGPRVPDLCARLEERMRAVKLRPLARIPAIVSDGLAGAWGEREGGALAGARGAYYAAGGSGLAEALVVDGKPRALDELRGIARAWELRDAGGIPYEDRIAPGRWPAGAGQERLEDAAARGDERAREALRAFARAFAELVARRAGELARVAREAKRLERVVVGAALGRLLARDANRWLLELVRAELAQRFEGEAPELALSELRAAPAIGAVALALERNAYGGEHGAP